MDSQIPKDKKYTQNQTYYNDPPMIICIYMDCIYRKFIKKPSYNDQKNTMGMEGNLREYTKIYRTKCKSSDRKKQRSKIESYKKCKCPLRYKKTNFSIFGRVF